MAHAMRRTISLLLSFLLVFNPMALAADGVVVDSTAPSANQPTLSAAPNGVPMVDIARPNAKGLSHNKFDQFNVDESGLILNNSKKAGRTQLGGVVVNNPNLGSGPEARVILNEVTGSSRSRLEGYTEIFGYPADYILANPNGITVNGGGFINTPRATLTTGKPRFDGYGGLTALDVRQGDVLIDGLGLNVSNLDAFDIISRTARINADVHALKLGITTGHGSYDVATGQFSALPADGSEAPAVALDSTALGGMYAERIILVGNEKGVGVNLEGITHATDELVLTADGKIRIKGRASSDKDIRVASGGESVEISGSLAAAKIADVAAAKSLALQPGAGGKVLLYGEDVRVESASLHNDDGRIEAGKSLTVTTGGDITSTGVFVSGADAALSAGGTVHNSGQMQANESLDIASAVAENSGRMLSIGAIRIHSAGVVANTGELASKKFTIVEAAANVLNSGVIKTDGQTSIVAGSLSNAGGNILAQGDLELAVAGTLSNTGILYSGASSRIQAGSMRNDLSGNAQALSSLVLELGADLENYGVMSAGEAVSLQAGGSFFNTGSILAQTGMELVAEGRIMNSGSMQSGGTGLYRSGGILLNESEILAVGEVVFDINGDLENSGTLHSGGGFYDLGGDLVNSGEILSSGELNLFLAADLFNSGTIAADNDVSFAIEGSLENTLDGMMLSSGGALFDVTGDLRNSGRIESTGVGAISVGGGLYNTDGDILSQTALEFDVQGVLENTGVMHSGDSVSLRSASLDNSGQILAQGNSVLSVLGDLLNRNFLFSGGEASFSVGGMLHNLRGQILSLGDMVLEGLEAGSRMLELKNDSGTIETLDGGMTIRGKVVRNTNLDFRLELGAEVVSRKGGYFSGSSDKWGHAERLYATLPGSSSTASKRNAIIITPAELRILGFGLDRNAIPRSELDAAIAAAEERFDLKGGTAGEIATVSNLKSRVVGNGVYMAVQHYRISSKVAAYLESITRDEVIGMEGGANIASANNLNIESELFRNSVSRVSTASGDITICTDEFENAGHDINEHRTIQWSRAHANRHKSPSLVFEGNGVEVVSTPIGHAYGTISAGGKVSISADHVRNGIVEETGAAGGEIPQIAYAGGVSSSGSIIAPPRPESLVQSVAHIGDLIDALPKNGLFSVNKTPGHRYLIETNPALTSMALFYGSDYFLSRTGIDLSKTQQQLLGDAFYETRLVREQIVALTGRRFLSDSTSSDSDQMLALMDNAINAREGLNLSVGVALSVEQVAALTSDIVWLETRVVEGREVLVPVVYLCRSSLDTIAQGGSVIIGRDVEVRTTGDTVNSGVIKATGDLAINAENVFNTFGTVQGDTVRLTADDSIFNISGLIKGRDVSLDAGQDIISGTAKTTFSAAETTRRTFGGKGPGFGGQEGASVFAVSSTTRTTSETVGQRGSIEVSGDLSMRAGRDIGIVGSDVKASGDATLSAGRNVAIMAQELESHNSGKSGSSKSSFNTRTSKASTVAAGGSVSISAGQDVAVQGSRVSAGADVNIEAGRDVSITAATEGYDYHFKQKSKGGFFGGSSSEMRTGKVTTNVASAITAGGDVNVMAGQGGIGDLTVAGSTIKSGVDMGLRAEGDLQVLPEQIENYSKVETKKSGFMGTGSMKLDESHGVTNVRSELDAGGKIDLKAGDSVILQSARITSGDEISITAENGQVAMLAAKDFFFERHVKSDTGYFSWSSSDKGAQDETVQHTEITAGKNLRITTANGVVVQYKETGNVRQDIEQLAQSPGLGWMGELLKRDDVNWQAVQEAHDKWAHEDSGIGGPGVQLVALAVAVALTVTGVGSAFATSLTGINSAAATAAGTTLTATQVAVHSAVAAGFNSLVSQASVQLVANQGDVGAVLKAMATEDTVRSLATVMLTAGLTQGLLNAAGVSSNPALLSEAESMAETMDILSTALQRTAIQAGVSAGVNTAINGGDLGQNLTNSLRTAAVTTLGAQVAGEIGLAYREGDLNYVSHKIAHAALGAAMGEALSGDAAAGAIGAVVGEMTAEAIVKTFLHHQLANPEGLKNLTDEEARQLAADMDRLKATGVDLSKLSAGLAAALAGKDIDTAATTGGNAAEHNALIIVPIVLELMDKGLQTYDAYRLAKAIEAGDTDEAAEISAEIALGAATDAIPANVVAIKIGIAVKKFGLAGLGAKIVGKFGDEAAEVAAKNLPRFQGPKPQYHVNQQHVPGRGLQPGKTPLPSDAESVFKNAVPNDPKNPTAWFGKNADGQIYRFSAGNDGTAHFSGIHGVGDGTRNLTGYAIKRLGGL